jgi:peptide/nickel transport system substrate-binding protein
MDNQELIDVLYGGTGTGCSWLPHVDDPEEAKRLLDGIGLDKLDAEGWRLGPDGKRFEFFIETGDNPVWTAPLELLKAHLAAVGLYTDVKILGTDLFGERRGANQLRAGIQWSDAPLWPYLRFDYMTKTRLYWPLWEKWMVTQGEDGEEPPDWIKEFYEIDAELGVVDPTTDRAEAAEKRVVAWWKEYMPMFPLAENLVFPVAHAKNLGNMPISGFGKTPMMAAEQFFFRPE